MAFSLLVCRVVVVMPARWYAAGDPRRFGSILRVCYELRSVVWARLRDWCEAAVVWSIVIPVDYNLFAPFTMFSCRWEESLIDFVFMFVQNVNLNVQSITDYMWSHFSK